MRWDEAQTSSYGKFCAIIFRGEKKGGKRADAFRASE